MAAPRSARQLRADDTRVKLFAAAIELFEARGYHDTTIDAIVKRAGVAKGTFFVHFATKDAVISELVSRQIRGARRARGAAIDAGAGPLAGLRATVLALGEQAAASRELSRAVFSATLDNAHVSGDAEGLFGEVLAEMIGDARAAVDAGELGRGRDGELLARALLACYFGSALHFASSRRSTPLLDVLLPLVDANVEGFRDRPQPAAGPRRPRRRR
jgi:AcrR family transcriptional regulator